MESSVLPDWLEQGIESSLRDSEDDVPSPASHAVTSIQSAVPRSVASSSRNTPIVLTPTVPSPAGSFGGRPEVSKGPWTDLDQFYADINTDEEQEEELEEASGEDEEGEEDSPDEESEEEEGDTDDEEVSSDEEGHSAEHQPLHPSG